MTLVDNKMNEFFVSFKGPEESESAVAQRRLLVAMTALQGLVRWSHASSGLTRAFACAHSPVRRRRLEDPRRVARRVPVQVAVDRVPEQDLSPCVFGLFHAVIGCRSLWSGVDS